MKLLNIIVTIALIVILTAAVWIINKPGSLEKYKNSNVNTEQVQTKDESKEKTAFEIADITQMNDTNASNSVFNYNFLFNLIYKFAYGELKR